MSTLEASSDIQMTSFSIRNSFFCQVANLVKRGPEMMSFLPNISSVAERAGVLESCRLTLIPVAPFICVKLSNLLKNYGLIFSFLY